MPVPSGGLLAREAQQDKVRRASKPARPGSVGNAKRVIQGFQSYDPGVGLKPGLRDAVLQPLQCFFNRSFN